MSHAASMIVMIIASFCLAGVILLKRESIPDKARKPLALTAIGLILFSFFLIVYSLVTLG
ncbi:hypothetical protein ACFSTH_10400 [Paenibacillus yanchengensis]|uniref:Signal transduction histidine kinase n=1 Tax=Paenibacillus yanchengensis TaxID=2035833 RepID=A0ABW4YP89_9BACL